MISRLAYMMGWPGGHRVYEGGGKGGGAAPPPPDYRGAAMEQAAASKEIATQTTWANRPQLNTPWGQQTWSASSGVDPSTGQPITNWTSNINLTPESQAALGAQQRITAGRSAGAETLLPQAIAGFQQPVNWAGMPQRGQVAQQTGYLQAAQAGPEIAAARAPTQALTAAGAGDVQGSQNRAYGIMSQMLEPGRSQRREALDAKLLASGVDPNSRQAQRSRAELSEQFAQQDKQMMAQALGEGRADVTAQYGMDQGQIAQQAQLNMQQYGMSREEATQMAQMQAQRFGQMSQQQAQQAALDQQRFQQQTGQFGQQNLLRQQAIAEEAQRRGMSLNELNALLTAQQVSMPQMPGFSAATQAQAPNLLGAAQAQGDYALGAAKLNQDSGGSDWGSMIGTIGGAAVSKML